MKSTSIIFITFNAIDKHLSHASQMHIHAYIRRVCDSEPFRHRRAMQMFIDPCGPQHVYAPCGHFSLLFSIFSYLIFSQKDFIILHIIDNHMTDFPHHHSIIYDFTPLYSPVYSTFSCYL